MKGWLKIYGVNYQRRVYRIIIHFDCILFNTIFSFFTLFAFYTVFLYLATTFCNSSARGKIANDQAELLPLFAAKFR